MLSQNAGRMEPGTTHLFRCQDSQGKVRVGRGGTHLFLEALFQAGSDQWLLVYSSEGHWAVLSVSLAQRLSGDQSLGFTSILFCKNIILIHLIAHSGQLEDTIASQLI